jgi:hypothetical protein
MIKKALGIHKGLWVFAMDGASSALGASYPCLFIPLLILLASATTRGRDFLAPQIK